MAIPDDRESDLRLGEYHILVLLSLFDVVLFYTILLMCDRFPVSSHTRSGTAVYTAGPVPYRFIRRGIRQCSYTDSAKLCVATVPYFPIQ